MIAALAGTRAVVGPTVSLVSYLKRVTLYRVF
jgi:hypothetical protein